MAKKRNHSRKNSFTKKKKAEDRHFLPPFVQGYIFGLVFLLLAAIVLLSFFELAGKGGQGILEALLFLLGRSAFVLPVFLVLAGVVFFAGGRNHQKIWKMTVLAFFSCLVGLSAVLNSFDGVSFSLKQKALGGLVGYFLSLPFLRIFGFWVNLVVFGSLIIFGFFIFWQVAKKIKPQTAEELAEQPPVLKKIFEPRFKIKEIKDSRSTRNTGKELALPPELKTKPIFQGVKSSVYKKPSLDFLEVDRGEPTTGDIRNNMAIIKNTLETFSIPVEMGEVNIGPTVTRYTLKPAEGIKLSKITALSNDLSLALATHPIRIEAPIPGKSLVGIEVPNKVRTQVRLRNIFETPEFQGSPSPLLFSLGRDVAGNPCFADLARMPHLLIAGSTGTGKTICLNSIVLSLLYRNSPETLRLIMIDPKRVEFPVYQEIPHLLSPVIFDSQKTVNVFKWLVKEMERRFEVLASAKARDIASYNREANFRLSKAAVKGQEEDLEAIPYIVIIVDELADLMAARGKEIEGGIVRLAQMARAVGIHLVVATQRPSVEVVTGLIKANITSRITFQVASQVDSRTVMDSAGAEKLLGAGDMLFISSETARPRRIQGAYVTDKEVKKVTDFLKSQREEFGPLKENFLAEELEKELEIHPPGSEKFYASDEDPLYLQAKQLVIEFRKASASLLQRRLRVGYARAARLLDILEDRGVVGPADGAKPREVYLTGETPGQNIEIKVKSEDKEDSDNGDGDWEKV
ncbi:MAG: DNA translocase FtsK [bacterium]|nr:DNA translocase FtsK [bacterium]